MLIIVNAFRLGQFWYVGPTLGTESGAYLRADVCRPLDPWSDEPTLDCDVDPTWIKVSGSTRPPPPMGWQYYRGNDTRCTLFRPYSWQWNVVYIHCQGERFFGKYILREAKGTKYPPGEISRSKCYIHPRLRFQRIQMRIIIPLWWNLEFHKRCLRLPNAQFFWTLFKKNADPPPSFWTLWSKFFLMDILKSA